MTFENFKKNCVEFFWMALFVTICIVVLMGMLFGLLSLIISKSNPTQPWEVVVQSNVNGDGLVKMRAPGGWIYKSQHDALLFVPEVAPERS